MDVFAYNQKVFCNSYLAAAATTNDDDGNGDDNGSPPHNPYFWSSALATWFRLLTSSMFFPSSFKLFVVRSVALWLGVGRSFVCIRRHRVNIHIVWNFECSIFGIVLIPSAFCLLFACSFADGSGRRWNEKKIAVWPLHRIPGLSTTCK